MSSRLHLSRLRRASAWLGALLLILLLPGRAAALRLQWSVEELTRAGDTVVRARVLSLSGGWQDEARGLIETTVLMAPSATFKGWPRAAAFEVHVPGGRVGDLAMVVSDQAVFRPGEEVLLFLRDDGSGRLTLVAADQGKLTIVGDEVGEEVRDAGGALRPLDETVARVLAAVAVSPSGTGTLARPGPGCPSVVGAPPPASAGPDDWVYNGMKWFGPDPMEEEYTINVNTDDVGPGNGTMADFRDAILQAAGTWTDVTAKDFAFHYGGATTTDEARYDGVNAVFWYDMGATSTLAESTVWYYPDSGQIVEADIAINDDYGWDATGRPDAGEPDVESVVLHELGHWLALDHDDDPVCGSCPTTGPVMCPCIRLGVVKRALHENEVAGIRALYPPGAWTATPSPTKTPVATRTPTATSTATPTPTMQPRPTHTATASSTPTLAAHTPTSTPTPTATPRAASSLLYLPVIVRD